jgi:hypothetical protein
VRQLCPGFRVCALSRAKSTKRSAAAKTSRWLLKMLKRTTVSYRSCQGIEGVADHQATTKAGRRVSPCALSAWLAFLENLRGKADSVTREIGEIRGAPLGWPRGFGLVILSKPAVASSRNTLPGKPIWRIIATKMISLFDENRLPKARKC